MFEGRLAGSLLPSSGWNNCQKPTFEDSLARSLAPTSGWSSHQKSVLEDLLARQLPPSSGWSYNQKSMLEEWLAGSGHSGLLRTWNQASSFGGYQGDDANTVLVRSPLDVLLLPIRILPRKLPVLGRSTMQNTSLLACKYRIRLQLHSECLALARFGWAPVLQYHDTAPASHLPWKQIVSKPSAEPPGPALQERPSKAIHFQSCTAREDQTGFPDLMTDLHSQQKTTSCFRVLMEHVTPASIKSKLSHELRNVHGCS